jgi:hypothetical protein
MGVFKVASLRIEQSFDNPILQTSCISLLLTFLESIVDYGQHGDLSGIFIEVILFLAENVQNSVLRRPPADASADGAPPKYSIEVKLVAKAACVKAVRLWYLNFQSTSEDSAAVELKNPLIPSQNKWGPLVVDGALALVNPPNLNHEEAKEAQANAIDLVKNLLATDTNTIRSVCKGLLNNGHTEDDPVILLSPAKVQLCTSVWECLAVNGDRLTSDLHMALLGACSNSILWDMDATTVTSIPQELKLMQTRMYEISEWLKESIIEQYFDAIRRIGINKSTPVYALQCFSKWYFH